MPTITASDPGTSCYADIPPSQGPDGLILVEILEQIWLHWQESQHLPGFLLVANHGAQSCYRQPEPLRTFLQPTSFINSGKGRPMLYLDEDE